MNKIPGSSIFARGYWKVPRRFWRCLNATRFHRRPHDIFAPLFMTIILQILPREIRPAHGGNVNTRAFICRSYHCVEQSNPATEVVRETVLQSFRRDRAPEASEFPVRSVPAPCLLGSAS